MKKFFVLKVYNNYFTGATLIFSTDSYEDAKIYADLMARNSEEGYTFHVGNFCIGE